MCKFYNAYGQSEKPMAYCLHTLSYSLRLKRDRNEQDCSPGLFFYPHRTYPKFMKENQWCVYLIEAENGKIYTGITNNLKARIQKHLDGTGAKFFRTTSPKTLLFVEEQEDKSSSLKREYEIKQLSRANKEALIESSPFEVIEITELLS